MLHKFYKGIDAYLQFFPFLDFYGGSSIKEHSFNPDFFQFFFYCGAVTQFLGGLGKGILGKEKKALGVVESKLLEVSFDRAALHQTGSCLFPRMKQETSDIPRNVDDSPLCVAWGGLLYFKGVFQLLH